MKFLKKFQWWMIGVQSGGKHGNQLKYLRQFLRFTLFSYAALCLIYIPLASFVTTHPWRIAVEPAIFKFALLIGTFCFGLNVCFQYWKGHGKPRA